MAHLGKAGRCVGGGCIGGWGVSGGRGICVVIAVVVVVVVHVVTGWLRSLLGHWSGCRSALRLG